MQIGELAKEALAKNKKNPTQTVQLREGDHGIVEAKVKAIRVWEWTEESAQPEERWLIIRALPDASTKLSLSNAKAGTSLKRLARWQAGRFWVERCFQDAKSHCGMGQYQARGWRAWHHHMALVALAVFFQMEERLTDPSGISNLTAADITEMIEWVIIRKPSEAELLERIRDIGSVVGGILQCRKRILPAVPGISNDQRDALFGRDYRGCLVDGQVASRHTRRHRPGPRRCLNACSRLGLLRE